MNSNRNSEWTITKFGLKRVKKKKKKKAETQTRILVSAQSKRRLTFYLFFLLWLETLIYKNYLFSLWFITPLQYVTMSIPKSFNYSTKFVEY